MPRRATTPDHTTSSTSDPSVAYTDRTDYPLTVVTTVDRDGERSGCLAGFVTQCSIEPPRFLVCLSKVNHTFEVVRRARFLTLHLLGDRQTGTASIFGEQSGDTVDKFVGVDWHPGTGGVPVLDDCVAWLTMSIIDRFDVGDHAALLTEPVTGGAGDQVGLMTFRTAPALEPGHRVD